MSMESSSWSLLSFVVESISLKVILFLFSTTCSTAKQASNLLGLSCIEIVSIDSVDASNKFFPTIGFLREE